MTKIYMLEFFIFEKKKKKKKKINLEFKLV